MEGGQVRDVAGLIIAKQHGLRTYALSPCQSQERDVNNHEQRPLFHAVPQDLMFPICAASPGANEEDLYEQNRALVVMTRCAHLRKTETAPRRTQISSYRLSEDNDCHTPDRYADFA